MRFGSSGDYITLEMQDALIIRRGMHLVSDFT